MDRTNRRQGRRRRAASTTLAVALAAGLGAAPLYLASGPVSATTAFAFTRTAGSDRFATAASIATATFPEGAGTVVLATGLDFPDALAGNFLAGNLHAPILLTTASSPVPLPTLAAIDQLGAKRVVIIGGTSAVSQDEQSSLAARGLAVSRVAGSDRYDTMRLIAEQPGTSVGRDSAGAPTAILATGATFPDALSAGSLSYADQLPVVLAGGQSSLGAQAAKTLSDLHIGHVVIVGGTNVVGPAVEGQLSAMDISVDREAGIDRSATSMALAQDEITNWRFSSAGFDLARGDDFADALAGGAQAGSARQPILVSLSPSDPGSASTFAAGQATTEAAATALGGIQALAQTTLSTIVAAVDHVLASAPPPPAAPPAPPSPPPPIAGSPFPAQATGYDISWPQCPAGIFPPSPFRVAIVGTNDGRAYTINPCLAAEGGWAGANLSFYINLNAPDDTVHSMSGPAGNCATSDLACQSYNYGYRAAVSSMADAVQEKVSSNLWWLDIETGNTWSSSTVDNAKVIAGAIDALHANNNTVAIYSTPYQWGLIAGSYQPAVASWVATGASPSDLAAWCSPSHAFTAGPVWLVQYGNGGFDGDYAC